MKYRGADFGPHTPTTYDACKNCVETDVLPMYAGLYGYQDAETSYKAIY